MSYEYNAYNDLPQVVPTGTFLILSKRCDMGGTARLIIQGTARVRIT